MTVTAPLWFVVPANAIAKSAESPLRATVVSENVIAPLVAALITFNSVIV